VNTASREDGHLAGCQRLIDHGSTILLNHVGLGGALNSDNKVCSTRMEVWGKHGTGTELDHSKSHAPGSESREGRSVGIDNRARGIGVVRLGTEVEDPVCFGVIDCQLVESSGGGLEKGILGSVDRGVDSERERCCEEHEESDEHDGKHLDELLKSIK